MSFPHASTGSARGMPPPQTAQVYRNLQGYLKALDEYESVEFLRMATEWNRIEADLQMGIDALTFEIQTYKLQGKTVDAAMIRNLDRMQSLLAQTQDRVTKFYTKSEDLVREGQAWHIDKGLEKGVRDIQESYAMASRYNIRFDLLPYRSIENMVGFAGDGSPLNTLLKTSYADNATAISQLLVDGIAMGIGPRETAVKMAGYMRGNLERAMTVARTEQIRCFRTANVAQYKESGVMDTYTRHCAFQIESCMACIAVDGKVYPVTVQFGDHPKGRCFPTANVKGVKPPAVLSGLDWFKSQPEATQIKMMGGGHYDAWKSGKFQLEDIAQIGHDETWGEQIRISPLSQLVNGGHE